MKIVKQYWLILLILSAVGISVLHRTCSHRNFKYDSQRHAGPSVERSNIISEGQFLELSGKALIVDLRRPGQDSSEKKELTLRINPDSILDPKNLDVIRRSKDPVIFTSSENGVSARIWMLLSQMGLKNIYILSSEPDPEALKNEFRPDTLNRPEL